MEITNLTNYIIASVGSVFAWIWANKSLVPLIVDWWNQRREKKKQDAFTGVEEVLSIKEASLDVSEKQFSVLLNQITALEAELQSYANELQKLRNTILRLNAKLYDKSLLITDLQKKCCENMECPNRIRCKNYICEMIEENEDRIEENI